MRTSVSAPPTSAHVRHLSRCEVLERYLSFLAPVAISVLIAGPFWLAAASPAAAGEVVILEGIPHVQNTDTPRDGVETLQLKELWRAGGEEDDQFFGVVSSAVADDAGNVYLLDMQLAEVQVYSPEGEWLKNLSREGDGPGEVRRPRRLLFMPDGTLGIMQGFPGKIVKIDLDGNPAGSLIPGDDPTAGGFNGLDDVKYRDGHLICCGNLMTRTDDGFRRTQYLASFEEDGKEKVRFLEKTTTPHFTRPEFREKEEYFVDRGRWALGTGGRIYCAPLRDRYAVHVYDPDGKLVRVIERQMEPWKRTQAEYDRVGDDMVIIANGRRLEVEKHIEDYEPSIQGLRVADDGYLWVLSSRSTRLQPEGIFQTYDVFDPEGHFVKQVTVPCAGSSEEDRLFLIDDSYVIVVHGAVAAARNMFGNAGREDEAAESAGEAAGMEAEPLEVVCYKIVS